MNTKSLKTLEFTKIRELLKSKAISQMGKSQCEKLEPITDLNKIEILQQETTESFNYIMKKGSLPLGGISDITESMKRVEMQGVLSISELMKIADFLYVCRKLKKYATKVGNEGDYLILDPVFEEIEMLSPIEREISRCVANENDLKDDASSELYRIRVAIKSSNQKIKDQLNNIIQSQSYKNMLQDTVVTMRNGRYCVPVKLEYKNTFNGIVHDQSTTGSTVFIEPNAVVAQNNKIRELQLEESKEIEKILAKLTNEVYENKLAINQNKYLITKLDVIFAKGELSILMNAVQPVFNERGYVNIKQGRHPLIDKKVVVPIDIYLGDKFSTLLITGPNTGGKTLSIKTVGLFTIMGQCGLHIPANSGSELSIFDNVFSDIGDEQSIEQSLSTFSSHMTNIISILDKVTDKSLVLLDELGAGTDPVEGAALAIAIWQYLYDRGCKVCVTTHYSELKLYALSTDGVENASCEFDVESLRPTYKLLIGIPGKSNAFSISKKLGLADFIIEDAKNLVSSKDEKFEDIITDLEIAKKEVLLEKEHAEKLRHEVEGLNEKIQREKERLENERKDIIIKAKQEARNINVQAKREADELIKQLNEQSKNLVGIKELDKTRQQIQANITDIEKEIFNDPKERTISEDVRKLRKGDEVMVVSMNGEGKLAGNIDNNDMVMVAMGNMKIKTHISNLQPIKRVKEKAKVQQKYSKKSLSSKSRTMTAELDLRGFLVHEGLQELEKFIDDAILTGLGQVSIIHGKGTGAMRNGVHDYLKRSPSISEYRLGEFGEGDMGVTIAKLK